MFNWIKSLFHREQTSQKEKTISGIIASAYIFGLGYLGNQWTQESQEFYLQLTKPEITPPDWVFSVVWLILFSCIAAAGYYAWNHYKSYRFRTIFAVLYVINGLLVFLWPHLFFTRQLITTALYALIGLIIITEFMILAAFRVNQKSAYLLIPYLGWLFFATYLNTAFIVLNS